MDQLVPSNVIIFSILLLHCVTTTKAVDNNTNIVMNPTFDDGLNDWTGKGCKIELHESMENGSILPQVGGFFALATERKETWNGIQQEITGRVQREVAYAVAALVRIYVDNNLVNNTNATTSTTTNAGKVQVTLWVQEPDFREEYIAISNLQVTDKDWVQMQGEFLLNGFPSRVVIYVEGPNPGIDILLNSLVVKQAEKPPASSRPVPEDSPFGVNIIDNSNLDNGTTTGWFCLGNCGMSIEAGSPHILPPVAKNSLGSHEYLTGHYIRSTNRSVSWMGPAQMITNKLRLYLTYQVSAWVRIGPAGSIGPQTVNIALAIDGQWINGGEVEASRDNWLEICGSFRIEKQPSDVMVYVQGPDSDVDLMVAGLHIFAVNRQARFAYLKKQTDKIRKRDIVLKFSNPGAGNFLGSNVKVKQTQNGFPLGSCVTRTSMDNEAFVQFLSTNFIWVVFENEMKWSWMEPQQGTFYYKATDELLDLCEMHNMSIRGHCIFWEMEYAIQWWVRSLNGSELTSALQNRLTDLLTRYKGRFKHYDVNNEMLHGSFYQDRLGNDIRAYMFRTAHQLDPNATFFVNDYHIEDGSDARSTPEKYTKQVVDLQQQGATTGGIGIQGHIESPIGTIVCAALDKLATLGIPIWFTELDVSSTSEYIRADDLEVMLREAYAHPAVEGVVLWGFWELYMSRKNAHLVNADGEVNEAGRRFLALKKEWLSNARGRIDSQGEFRFRGFPGTYNVEIVSSSKKINKTFVVDQGQSPSVILVDLK